MSKGDSDDQHEEGNDEISDVTFNPYGLYNTILLGKLKEAADDVKALKEEIKAMQDYHQIKLRELTEINTNVLKERENNTKEHINKVSRK